MEISENIPLEDVDIQVLVKEIIFFNKRNNEVVLWQEDNDMVRKDKKEKAEVWLRIIRNIEMEIESL